MQHLKFKILVVYRQELECLLIAMTCQSIITATKDVKDKYSGIKESILTEIFQGFLSLFCSKI